MIIIVINNPNISTASISNASIYFNFNLFKFKLFFLFFRCFWNLEVYIDNTEIFTLMIVKTIIFDSSLLFFIKNQKWLRRSIIFFIMYIESWNIDVYYLKSIIFFCIFKVYVQLSLYINISHYYYYY